MLAEDSRPVAGGRRPETGEAGGLRCLIFRIRNAESIGPWCDPKREFCSRFALFVTAKARTCAPRGRGVGPWGSPRSARVGSGAKPRLDQC